MKKPKKLSLASKSIIGEEKEKLRQLFPEIFTEDKVDFDKLKTVLGDEVDLGARYGLSWKGKNNVFRAIQETTTKTLKPDREESVDFDKTGNLFIEGDNLEVLKILQRSYYGKVKMIYIDPPYNTGNDVVYKDKFTQAKLEYEQEAGIRNEEGYVNEIGLKKNTKDGGHFHSNWLTMMYPRLYLARNLLREDGVIFASIDDNEVSNLRTLLNEIFGEENFLGVFIWRNKAGGGGKQGKNKPEEQSTKQEVFVVDHEYILCYSKTPNVLDRFNLELTDKEVNEYINIDNDPRGPYKLEDLERSIPTPISTMYYELKDPDGVAIKPKGGRFQWRRKKERVLQEIETKEIIWHKVKCQPEIDKRRYYYRPKTKQYLKNRDGTQRTKSARSILHNLVYTRDGAIELRELFDGKDVFDNPKPTGLIYELLSYATEKGDLILDFFAGSGSSADAAYQLSSRLGSRKWIMVQLPEPLDPKDNKQKQAYEFCKTNGLQPNVAAIGEERIRRAAMKLSKESEGKLKLGKSHLDLGFKAFKLDKTNFKMWDGQIDDPRQLEKQMQNMFNSVREDAKEEDLVFELMLKVGIVPTASFEKKTNFWAIDDGKLAICLAKKVDQKMFEEILAAKPEKAILLDRALTDQLKANLLLQAEKAKTEVLVV